MRRLAVVPLLLCGLLALAGAAMGTGKPKHPASTDHFAKTITISYRYDHKHPAAICIVSVVPPKDTLSRHGHLVLKNADFPKGDVPAFIEFLGPSKGGGEDDSVFGKGRIPLKATPDGNNVIPVTLGKDGRYHSLELQLLWGDDPGKKITPADCLRKWRILGNPQFVVDGSGT